MALGVALGPIEGVEVVNQPKQKVKDETGGK